MHWACAMVREDGVAGLKPQFSILDSDDDQHPEGPPAAPPTRPPRASGMDHQPLEEHG